MTRCSECAGAPTSSACQACGATTIDGFVAYAPDLARSGGGYDPELFARLAGLEQRSFWFTSRNRLIRWALRRWAPDLSSFCEIGCGTGFVLSGVAEEFDGVRLVGSEIFVEALPFVRERLPAAELVQMDARDIPWESEFDAIGAFDVLEHIEEDDVVLAQMYAALRPGGLLVVSVPQHRWLWSAADEHAHHVRRYTGAELRSRVRGAGFEVLRDSSFVTLLLPLMILSRMLRRSGDYDPESEMSLPAWLNTILSGVMAVERLLIVAGLRLPIGGSRLIVARRGEDR